MVWLYIILGISVALNIGLGVALYKLHNKYSKTAKQLHLYNVCAGGMHCD